MPYSTQTDIERVIGADRVIQLSDDDGDQVADAAVLTDAIAWGDALVNSYAAGRYALPFTPATPPEISDRSAELASYWLYRRKQNKDETIQKMYADAIAWLKDLQSGKVNVTADVATAAVGAGIGSAQASAKDTIFTDEKLDGF